MNSFDQASSSAKNITASSFAQHDGKEVLCDLNGSSTPLRRLSLCHLGVPPPEMWEAG
jgi:hypothetical protein